MKLNIFKEMRKEYAKLKGDSEEYSGEKGLKPAIYFQHDLKEKEKEGNRLVGKIEVAIKELMLNSSKKEEWENFKKDADEISDGYAAIEKRVFGNECNNPDGKKE